MPVDLYYYFGLEHAVAGEISPSMLPSATENYFSLAGSTPSTNNFLLSVFDSKSSLVINIAYINDAIRLNKVEYKLRWSLNPGSLDHWEQNSIVLRRATRH